MLHWWRQYLAGPADDTVLVGAIVCLAQVVAALIWLQLLASHTHCHWAQVLIYAKEVLVICTPRKAHIIIVYNTVECAHCRLFLCLRVS